MRSGSQDYIPVESNAPLRGLATMLPATRIDPSFSPGLLNVVVRDGVALRRAGYLQLGQTLEGVVLGLVEFGPIGSAVSFVALTSTRQYRFNSGTNTWTDITKRRMSTFAIEDVTKNAAPTDDFFELFAASGNQTSLFPAGTKIVVIGSSSNNGVYTVSASSFTGGVTRIEVDEEIPSATPTTQGSIEVASRFPITAVDQGADTFTVAGDQTTIFVAGAKFFVVGSTGNDGYYTVVTSTFGAATVIEVVEEIPNAVADGHIQITEPWTTTDADFIDYIAVTDVNGRRLLITNGVNNPRQWSGSLSEPFLRWEPTYEDFVTNKTFAVFSDSLFMGNVTAASSEPQIIAWSDSGDFNDFVSGNAGLQLLHQLTGGIRHMRPLGDRLVIYSPDAIANGVFVGSPAIFAFEVIIPEGTRLISPKSIVSINIGHVYGSEENFYLFDGTRGLRVASETIRADYKETKDHNNLHRVCSINDYSKRTLYFAVPDIEGRTTVYTVEYDIYNPSNLVWSKERYTHQVRAFGFFTNTTVITWADTAQEAILFPSGMPWNEEIGPWGNEGEQVDFPVRSFGDEAGRVFVASEGVLKDNGTSEPGYYETPDFTIPEAFLSSTGRWGEVEFEARGGSMTVSVSVDLGATWTVISTTEPGGSFVTTRVPFDKVSRTLRIRFDFSGDFVLRWVRAWVNPGGPR